VKSSASLKNRSGFAEEREFTYWEFDEFFSRCGRHFNYLASVQLKTLAEERVAPTVRMISE
jgi:hypothetical protein